jgi:putative two-component system response regulator
VERVGYDNCAEADSVPAARRVIREEGPFALVILDLHMPGESGFELLSELAPLAPDTVVIMATGMAESNLAVDSLRSGAYDFLLKPLQPAAIQIAVGRALRKRRLELEEQARHDAVREMVKARTQALEATRSALLLALCHMAEFRDPETGAHLRRIPAYARILGEQMARNSPYAGQIDEEFLARLEESAPLHDIGKVSIPDSVLLKPGRLEAEEFEQIKKHTVRGREVCLAVRQSLGGGQEDAGAFIDMAVDITYGHHECWGGTGYPRGAKGVDIPLSARIVQVADFYDACRSPRVYRPDPIDRDKVFSMIRQRAGTQFDPEVAAAFEHSKEQFIAIEDGFQD